MHIKNGVNSRKMRVYGKPSATMASSPPISRSSASGQNTPASTKGTARMQAQKMPLEKYRRARSSPCALRMAYRVAEPRAIMEPMAKMKL